MEQVEEICDHIVLVNKGKKILDGTVGNVKQEFKENIFSIGADKDRHAKQFVSANIVVMPV